MAQPTREGEYLALMGDLQSRLYVMRNRERRNELSRVEFETFLILDTIQAILKQLWVADPPAKDVEMNQVQVAIDAPRLDEIRRRTNAATPGPWRVEPDARPDIHTVSTKGGYMNGGHLATMAKYDRSQDDAAFVAHAREDIMFLLDMVDRLTKGGNVGRGS